MKNYTWALTTRNQHGEHWFSDGSWLMLHRNEIHLIGQDNMARETLRFRSFADAAKAWPILAALPSAAIQQEAAR